MRQATVRASEPRPLTAAGLAGLVAVEAAALAAALFAIDPRRRPIVYAMLVGVASLPWLWVCRSLLVGRRRVAVRWILAGGSCLRVLALAAPPAVLSDDIYRYVWEGRVQLHGHNPFVEPPASLADIGRGDPVWERVNNKKIPAAYPPLGQLWLRLLAATGGGPAIFRAGFAFCDLVLMFLLAAWLARIGKDPSLVAVHALCPLAVVEMCVEGHNDSLAIALLVAAFVLLGRGRASLAAASASGGLLGAAISAKLLPVVLVPWFARRDWRGLPAALLVVALGYAVFWPASGHFSDLFQGLHEYGARWRSNESAFAAIIGATEWVMKTTGWFPSSAEPQRLSKIPVALLFLAGAAVVYRRDPVPARAFVALLVLLFVLAPALHPWYVVWTLPFLAVRPCPAAFLLATTVSLSYHVLPGWHYPPPGAKPAWEESAAWKVVEYAPFYASLAWAAWPRAPAGRRNRAAAPDSML